MPAVGGVASVLGIKCVNLFPCACVYCSVGREGGCDVQFDTNRGEEGGLLASLGGSWPQVWPFCRVYMQYPFQHIPLVYDTSPLLWFGTISNWLWIHLDHFYFSVKVNVWCKWTLTSYGWLPVGYAVFMCTKGTSTVWISLLKSIGIALNFAYLPRFDHQNVFWV